MIMGICKKFSGITILFEPTFDVEINEKGNHFRQVKNAIVLLPY